VSTDPSLLDLFRREAETQVAALTSALLAIERGERSPDHLEACMRAAHSLKGAARIVGLNELVPIAHAMEDAFVAAQRAQLTIGPAHIDVLLEGVDVIARRAQQADAPAPGQDESAELEAWLAALRAVAPMVAAAAPPAPADPPAAAERGSAGPAPQAPPAPALRVTTDSLNRLLGLSGESLVASRWARPFGESLRGIARLQRRAATMAGELREALGTRAEDDDTIAHVAQLQETLVECHRLLTDRLGELEAFDRRTGDLSRRLYDETLASRMRPFGDITGELPRSVRDLARDLGKQARLELIGGATPVGRDVLARLDAPLAHLVRNAVDHGIERPESRTAAGKPAAGVITIEARHHRGALLVTVADDGGGIDVAKVRDAVVARGLIGADAAAGLSEAELLEFLFLPGFTLTTQVTEISGRGVGLDAVRDMVAGARGRVRVIASPGRGTRFELQLPIALSVMRALVVEIAGEPYAFPLASVNRVLKVANERVESLEGRQYVEAGGERIGLVTAHQVLDLGAAPPAAELPIVVVGPAGRSFGLAVDRLLGEEELVVQPLDPQLGKVQDIAAAAVLADGAPLLIFDVDDLLRSLDRIAASDRLAPLSAAVAPAPSHRRKRVLVVDDSLTVRELQRKLLQANGYDVDVAVDGMEGWNTVRGGHFDLVVTDVDMPRMDGIELVHLIKGDARLGALPVMIVSYKDRDEDRRRGLDAGAAYYLTKSSFHDDTLVQAVVNLIGEARA
jgi:two-component system sensor histidine kinase and response regulator WspE